MKSILSPKLFFLSLIFLSSSVLVSCSDDSENSGSSSVGNQSSIPSVEAVKSRIGSLPLSERLSGTVYAKSQVSLFPEISGKIATVHVQNGEYVEEGDPIVSLGDRQYREQVEQARSNVKINEARLKQAQARYNELEAQYRRTKQLSDQELSSELEIETLEAQMSSAEADVDLAEAQLEQAQSNLEEQQELLSQTVIKAPISGTVGQRNAETGMQVSSGTQLFTIGDLNNLRVEVVLTDQMLDNIEIGQTARVYTGSNANDSDFIEAELSRISPFLNNVTRSTEGEIDISNNNGELRPGMFVPVDILYGESQQATLVPTSAIYNDPTTGEDGVFVATSLGSEIQPAEQIDPENPPPLTDPTEVQFKPVDVIAEGRMEVGVEGIDPGNWVITVGQNLLAQGSEEARVRTSSWERILALQNLQRQDLLQRVLDGNTNANDTSSQ